MSFCGVQEDLLFAAGRVNLSDGAQRVLTVLVADLRQYDDDPHQELLRTQFARPDPATVG